MSYTKDMRPAVMEGQRIWWAEIATEPNYLHQRVSVVIPDFDKRLRWGPCRWQSRDNLSLPARGDACIVMFDNRREPWIVAWWPFDT